MKTTHFPPFFIFLFFVQLTAAQSSILGKVTDGKGPVSFANVLLLQSADSSLLRGEVSGDDGSFAFKNVAAGNYLLSTSSVGFTADYRKIELSAGKDFAAGDILLSEDLQQLDAVMVTAKKPLFEQKIDRLVVNVEGSITSAGATALEVLERSPGVAVNRQNNLITVAGKNGVIVMMNGKINRMPIEAVVQMLAGMPSGNIEKIEIITTPPANFDAEGNAGYINIVMKQRSDLGLNGSYTLAFGVGNGTVPSAGVNFNYRKNKLNIFGDYSFNRQAQRFVAEWDRVSEVNGQVQAFHTRAVRDPSIQRNHNARLGLDLSLSNRTVLGFLVSGYDNYYSQDSKPTTSVTYDGSLDSILTVHQVEVNHWQHLGGNVNLQHTFSGKGVLNFDVDYLHYYNDQPADYWIDHANGEGEVLRTEQTFSGKKTPIDVTVGRLDYSKSLSQKVKLDLGVKGTSSRFDNDVTVYYVKNGVNENDPELSGEYELHERIGAAFTSLDMVLNDNTNVKMGLRYEYTDANLGTVEQPNIVDRQYGRFFPSLFFSRTINENQSANFSYSRRISRPAYTDMAPFVFFFDPFTFFTGNPALQPSISNNVKVDYRLKTALFSAQYSIEDDAIARFQLRAVEGSNRQTMGPINMKNRKTAALTATIPLELTKWWSMQNNFIGTWQEANAYFGEDLASVSSQYFQFVWINSFKLPKGFSAELMGFYQSKSLSGTNTSLPMRFMNIGFQKKLRDDIGTLRFGIDDLFDSMYMRWDTNFPEYNLVSKGKLDFSNRTYKLTFSRNFGNNKLNSARQRATGSEEERKRVN